MTDENRKIFLIQPIGLCDALRRESIHWCEKIIVKLWLFDEFSRFKIGRPQFRIDLGLLAVLACNRCHYRTDRQTADWGTIHNEAL